MFLYIIFNGDITDVSQIRSICPDIPSEPEALLGLRFLMSFKMSSSLIDTEFILYSVLYSKSGRAQSSIPKGHCFAKYWLKNYAFSVYFKTIQYRWDFWCSAFCSSPSEWFSNNFFGWRQNYCVSSHDCWDTVVRQNQLLLYTHHEKNQAFLCLHFCNHFFVIMVKAFFSST